MNLTPFERLNRARARSRVRQAIVKGALVRGPCRYAANGDCNGTIEAHHYKGYEFKHWLDVMWFCHRHHGLISRKDWGQFA